MHANLDAAVGELGSFSFADYFFDCLIVDWMVQGRIHEAQSRVSAALSAVMSVARELTEQAKQVAARVAQVERDHAACIESAR